MLAAPAPTSSSTRSSSRVGGRRCRASRSTCRRAGAARAPARSPVRRCPARSASGPRHRARRCTAGGSIRRSVDATVCSCERSRLGGGRACSTQLSTTLMNIDISTSMYSRPVIGVISVCPTARRKIEVSSRRAGKNCLCAPASGGRRIAPAIRHLGGAAWPAPVLQCRVPPFPGRFALADTASTVSVNVRCSFGSSRRRR